MKVAYSISEAMQVLGVSRSFVMKLLQTGKLRSVKVGRRRLIPRAAIDDLLSGDQD